MELIKPINVTSGKLNKDQRLTSAEMAKLWSTYMGNSMSNRILSYYLKHVEDKDIKILLENGYNLTVDFMNRIKDIFTKEKFPIPVGFTEDDVYLKAPRLFEDEFYVHYLKYAAKAGLSLYAVAIPLVMRDDIRELFSHCNKYTELFIQQINLVLMNKGFIIKPPEIPVPENVNFVHKQKFLNGFFGEIRPLHAMEITHLYDNMENNTTSKALLIGFSQVARNSNVREFLHRGIKITDKEIQMYQKKLQNENLPAPSLLDHLVTTSNASPFSDKIMLFHKVDMFNIKIRHFGNSMSLNGRRDIGLMYAQSISDVARYAEDGANILIDNGWMERPPSAVDRENISSE
ncbi:DUF3231 family protein [Fredinandcohnia sp. 179-A 10B2 NHS]|uniref:DUF3231 family protein n=1 Tax=Fredinandcohnia sp. 179-A 10B2 NHS TaxID=3235176 RepID=UPI0039A2BD07